MYPCTLLPPPGAGLDVLLNHGLLLLPSATARWIKSRLGLSCLTNRWQSQLLSTDRDSAEYRGSLLALLLLSWTPSCTCSQTVIDGDIRLTYAAVPPSQIPSDVLSQQLPEHISTFKYTATLGCKITKSSSSKRQTEEDVQSWSWALSLHS